MAVSDPIADFLVQLKNAQMAGHKEVETQASKMRIAILKILKKEGFIEDYKDFIEEKKWKVKVYLKYYEGKPLIRQVKRISKPGRRIYVKCRDIPLVRNNMGIGIYSTPKGVLTHKEALKEGVGGEYICEIW